MTKTKWPKKDELSANGGIDSSPYGILGEYADSVFLAYEKKITGVITTAFRQDTRHGFENERTDFVYGLYLANIKGARIKIIELKVQNDGWYPASVSILYPIRQDYGQAGNGKELDSILEKAVSSNEIKSIIVELLR